MFLCVAHHPPPRFRTCKIPIPDSFAALARSRRRCWARLGAPFPPPEQVWLTLTRTRSLRPLDCCCTRCWSNGCERFGRRQACAQEGVVPDSLVSRQLDRARPRPRRLPVLHSRCTMLSSWVMQGSWRLDASRGLVWGCMTGEVGESEMDEEEMLGHRCSAGRSRIRFWAGQMRRRAGRSGRRVVAPRHSFRVRSNIARR